MIRNGTTIPLWNTGQGEGKKITPHILLWRSVIVRAIMDALDVDIHAWGKHRLQIVKNANAYVDQFKDSKREKLISLLVLDKYFSLSGQNQESNHE